MNNSRLISADNQVDWVKALDRCGKFDVYHLPQYHLLAESMGEGRPYLFFYQDNDIFAALPFLLRPVAEVDGLEGSQCNDITSVYGYPGIVTSLREEEEYADIFRRGFQEQLLQLFITLEVVTVFSRTNPFSSSTWLLAGMAEISQLSKTVAINLYNNDEEQLKGMSKTHKYDIRKARKSGVIAEEDPSFQHLDEFISMYNNTMQRKGASNYYYFSKEYYLQLKNRLGESIRLFFARYDGQAISASMFLFGNQIIHYHLSGSFSKFSSLNGAKLILDDIRQCGKRHGYNWLNLGGGVGSSEDNLYRFKAGFSKVRLPFNVFQMIADRKEYSGLYNRRRIWAQDKGHILADQVYFPNYRMPIR